MCMYVSLQPTLLRQIAGARYTLKTRRARVLIISCIAVHSHPHRAERSHCCAPRSRLRTRGMKRVALANRSAAAFQDALPDEQAPASCSSSSFSNGSGLRQDMTSTTAKYMAKVAEQELVDILSRVEVFSALTESKLALLAKTLQKSEYKKNKWVFKQGEIGDRFYIITSGTAEVIRSSDGYEELLSELGEGQFFGERSLMQQEPRFASIRATSQLLRTLSISKEAFEEVLGPLETLVKKVEY